MSTENEAIVMSPANQIDVLTYNVWLRPSYFQDGQAQRVDWLGQLLGKGRITTSDSSGFRGTNNLPDVLVLCEVFHHRLGRRLLEALEPCYPYRTHRLGGMSAPYPFGSALKLTNGGVVILSRWPIEKQEVVTFDGTLRSFDAFSCKGVHYAQINKKEQKYHIFGTHCQAEPESFLRLAYRFFGRDADANFWNLRQGNYKRVRELIDGLKIPQYEPVIIAGDMNTDKLAYPQHVEVMLEMLNAALPTEINGYDCTCDPVTNSLASGGRPQWLDYVLWSRAHLPPLSSSLDVKIFYPPKPWRRYPLGREYNHLSDHFAVQARMIYPNASSPSRK